MMAMRMARAAIRMKRIDIAMASAEYRELAVFPPGSSFCATLVLLYIMMGPAIEEGCEVLIFGHTRRWWCGWLILPSYNVRHMMTFSTRLSS